MIICLCYCYFQIQICFLLFKKIQLNIADVRGRVTCCICMGTAEKSVSKCSLWAKATGWVCGLSLIYGP